MSRNNNTFATEKELGNWFSGILHYAMIQNVFHTLSRIHIEILPRDRHKSPTWITPSKKTSIQSRCKSELKLIF